MTTIVFDSIFISATTATILAFVLDRIPGLSTWFEANSPEYKRLFVTVIMVLVGFAAVGLTCYSPFIVNVECNTAGFWEIAAAVWSAIVLGVTTNQSVHLVFKKGKKR